MIRFLIDGAREIAAEFEAQEVDNGGAPWAPEWRRTVARDVLHEHILDLRAGRDEETLENLAVDGVNHQREAL